MVKKSLGLLLSAVLVLTLLSACGQKNDTSGNEQENAEGSDEKIELRFMTWDSGPTMQPYQNAINAFMEKNPNIRVKVESVPDNYDQKLLVGMSSGTAPDVFMAWNFPAYAPSGGMEPLGPYVEKDKLDLSIYHDVILKYMGYQDVMYGLPTVYSTRAIYYNKKLFDDAKLPYPQEGWTWKQFQDTVTKLTKPGQYGFISTPDDLFTMQGYFWSNGGDLVSDEGRTTQGVLNSEQNVKTVQFLKELYNASSKINSSGKFSTNNGLESFQTGQIAMFDNGMWPIGDIVKEGKIDLGVVTHPVPEGGTLKGIVHTSGYSMSKSSEHKDAAWELIKFMSGPEGSKIVTANKFAFSAIKSVDEESGYANDPLLQPFMKEMENADKLIASNRYEKWGKAEDVIKMAIQKIFLSDADIKKTLDDAAADADKVLK